MLLACAQINDSQQQDLAGLIKICQEYDGGLPSIYHHLLQQKRESSSTLFYYHQQQLIGFISVYFFWPDACEISLLIAPTHRRQGIARQLVQAIMLFIRSKSINRLIFSAPPKHLEQWLPSKGFIKQPSEYHMERDTTKKNQLPTMPKLSMRLATIHDIEVLCAIDMACFPINTINMTERFHFLLNHQDYTVLLALIGETIIGKAHIHWQSQCTLLSDIAILPSHQQQGLGSELLAHSIDYAKALSLKTLALDVEAHNQQALGLYQRHGFVITNSHDYWSISVDCLF